MIGAVIDDARSDDLQLTTQTAPTLLLTPPARASRRDTLTGPALRLADVIGLILAAGSAMLVFSGGSAAGLGLFSLAALAMVQLFGMYGRDAVVMRAGLLDELPRSTQALTFAAAVTVLAGPAITSFESGAVVAAWMLSCVALPATRKAARIAVRNRTSDERVLIVGSGAIADLVATKIAKHPELGLSVVGCLDTDGDDRHPLVMGSGLPHLGVLADVERVVEEHAVHSVVIAFSAVPHEDLLDAIRRCKRLRLKISVVPRLFEVIGSRVELHDVEGLTLLGLRGPERSRGAIAAKRAMDVSGAGLALVFLSPLLALIALAVRLSSPGPALFRQERIGLRQRPFSMIKFRTMVDGADDRKAELAHLNEAVGGPMFKILADPRVTPVGRFLRATSLDELPQFLNVLRGEMSIVGPRPLIRCESDAVLGWHRTRLDLTPGLTGPWQVMGRQNVPFDEMVKLDYLYVAEWSFWNDVKLAVRTIPVMLQRTGA
jgi:exopolysaccharide biosynthesis polyprenyl glycosylphosphotransferase